MNSFKNIVSTVDSHIQESEKVSAKLKAQINNFSILSLELIPDGLDAKTAYNFCLVYNVLTANGFKFAGYCPTLTDLQWIVYRNQSEETRPCSGRLLCRDGQWKTDALAGNFTGYCRLDEFLKAADVVVFL